MNKRSAFLLLAVLQISCNNLRAQWYPRFWRSPSVQPQALPSSLPKNKQAAFPNVHPHGVSKKKEPSPSHNYQAKRMLHTTPFQEALIAHRINQERLNHDFARALRWRDSAEMSEFINQGASLDMKNEYGETPLIAAVRDNNNEGALLLLKAGANPNARIIALTEGFKNVAREYGPSGILITSNPYFVENGQSSNPLSALLTIGKTALHLAVMKNNLLMARCLLEYGANPSLQDIKGRTAASYANTKEMRALFNDYYAGKIKVKTKNRPLEELD